MAHFYFEISYFVTFTYYLFII